MTEPPLSVIHRFSSCRQRLDRSFLAERLQNARSYDRIAGYFSSSLLELVGEELESVTGPIRVICNSDLDPLDVQIKGLETDQNKAKHEAAKRWVAAVNNWGELDRWAFHVNHDPQVLGLELKYLVAQSQPD